MKPVRRHSLAIIADAHFHDLEADFGVAGTMSGDRRLMMRSWADTRTSTRVFNESAAALEAALATIRERGVRHVVLLGDYTDDGQRVTTARLASLLHEQTDRYGMQFYALPGNHDIFGPNGRHHTKRFLASDGSTQTVSSDEKVADAELSAGMYCDGYPAGLSAMAAFGYFGGQSYLHWETPFGSSPKTESRQYQVVSADGENRFQLMDASYLVEPEEGLWLLMIDANVFEPRSGPLPQAAGAAFLDSSNAGWNAMLRHKPFIVDWIADVTSRAARLGKTLLTFSHYPVIDPFDDQHGFETRLFPLSNMARRRPTEGVADALLATGLRSHFSGHLHVDTVTHRQSRTLSLTNVAVPSLVAYPPAFKILDIGADTARVETVDLSSLPLDPDIMQMYHRETARTLMRKDGALFTATYGEFLRAHTNALVTYRYFPQEWPKEVADILQGLSLEQLCLDERTAPPGLDAETLEAKCRAAGLTREEFATVSVVACIADWYCLRQAGALALSAIGDRRLRQLAFLVELYRNSAETACRTCVLPFLVTFLQSLKLILNRAQQPAGPFLLPLSAEGDDVPVMPSDRNDEGAPMVRAAARPAVARSRR